MEKLHYQKILAIKKDNPTSINPLGPPKIGAFENFTDFEQGDIIRGAFQMSTDLDEIHKMVSSANRNEKEIVKTIQAMFEK